MSAREQRAAARDQRSAPVVVAAPAPPAAVARSQKKKNTSSRSKATAAETAAAVAAAARLISGVTGVDRDSDGDDEESMPDQVEGGGVSTPSQSAESRQLAELVRQQQQQIAALQAAQHQPPSQSSVVSSSRFAKKEPRASDLREFDGSADELDRWVNELGSVIGLFRLTADETVQFAVSRLRDAAWYWWTDLGADGQSMITNADALTSGLRARFQPITTAKVARSQLDQLRQGQRHINEYISEFQRLRARVPRMTDDEAVHVFERGLRSDIAAELRKSDVGTVAAAIALAARIGGLTPASTPSTSNPHNRPAASANQMYDANDMQQMVRTAVLQAMQAQQSSGDIGPSTNVLSGNSSVNGGGRFQRGGRRGGGGFNNRPTARQLPVVPGVSPEIVQQRWDAKQCLRCGSLEHRAISCPNAIVAYGQGK